MLCLKKSRRCQTFLGKYHEKYPVLTASRKSTSHAHCTLRKRDFSVKAAGMYDCTRHIESASHKGHLKSDTGTRQSKLDAFVSVPDKSNKDDFDMAVTRAEAMICHIIADANLSTDGQNYAELSLVMRGILTIPHSSAHCERVFSCVLKNRTPQRASLADTTLESLLVLKSNPLGPVEAVRMMKNDTLVRLRHATQGVCQKSKDILCLCFPDMQTDLV